MPAGAGPRLSRDQASAGAAAGSSAADRWITGATGNLGRHLVRALDARDAELRLLVRDPARAAALPARAERVVGGLGEPAALEGALAGVEKMFLLTPGIGAAHTEHAVATSSPPPGPEGVRHLVHLSSATLLGGQRDVLGRRHHAREEIVRAGGVPATVLRPGGFMTNALEWVGTIGAEGYVLDPVGPGRIAPIDPADVAAVAAKVLTEDGHRGTEYVLTGDECLTVAEQVRILAATLGRSMAAASRSVRHAHPARPSGRASRAARPGHRPTPSARGSG
ncbi:SDR family oxidoreductase [Kitasatospora sp. NPDC059795]|uniref:SDR family oxidoreductase n=1 Tax=Kitasatospora sp. NPDC059795 TaxID=3346949 RepID=UPI00364DC5D0